MSIINREYFVGKIFISHAVESISDDNEEVALDIIRMIDEYERDCLLKSLGRVLYKEFFNQLDDTSLDGLIIGADQKWDDLLNGKDYINPDGDSVNWRGIRFESVLNSGDYNKSFLANYIYFRYRRSEYITVGSTGHQISKSKNAEPADFSKEIDAWNKFYDIVQGENYEPTLYETKYGLGVDYNSGDNDITLYQFIEDSNELIEDTYADFNPKTWEMRDNFGII